VIDALAIAEREIWTRRSVTRDHIDCAIELLFSGGPKASINLLAAAANDVLRGVLEANGKRSVLDEILDAIPAESRKEAIKLFKLAYNFSKHADADPDVEIAMFRSFCDFTIFGALSDYKGAYGKWSISMLIFSYWFASKHEEWLKSFRKDLILHGVDWFSADNSAERARSILHHFVANPDEVKKVMTALGQDWIECP
jgi:hypothetical protein